MSFEHQFNIFIGPDFLLDPTNTDHFTTPEQYELDVRNALIAINRTEGGRILLRSIKWHGKWVRISPVIKAIGASHMHCRGDSANWGEAKDLEFYRNTKPVFDLFQVKFTGIKAVVRFNPDQHAPGGNCFIDNIQKGDFAPTPESVLLHELVHAFRHVSKKFDGLPMTQGGLHKYDANEEFYAVLVENIFRSELRGNIRQSHQGFFNLEEELKGSFLFFKVGTQAFDLIDKFCRENPGLTKSLAKIKTPFNPIAAYYQNPRKAKEMSRSETAVRRDVGAFAEVIPGMSWQMWLKFL